MTGNSGGVSTTAPTSTRTSHTFTFTCLSRTPAFRYNPLMKIALIGTHGVGKTTLCYELAARLKRRNATSRSCARWPELPTADQRGNDRRRAGVDPAHPDRLGDRGGRDPRGRPVRPVGPRQLLLHGPRRRCCPDLGATGRPLARRPMTELVYVPLWSRPSYDGVRAVDPELPAADRRPARAA